MALGKHHILCHAGQSAQIGVYEWGWSIGFF